MSRDESVHGLVDQLFRREAGRMVASLTRSFGPAHLALAEEVVQEALIQALKRWPFGVPDQPVAWLYRVARNLALDRLRRHQRFRGKAEAVKQSMTPPEAEDDGVFLAGEITDDQLRLIFLCCHPELGRDARVALTLKTVLGFSVREIARAFLSRESTVAQRLVRAQRRIKDRGIPFEVPGPQELPSRLDAVLEALYLAFNEGYGAHEGDRLVRADLCAEALRMVTQLALRTDTGRPAVHALAALLCFQASRLPARVDVDGDLRLLAEQDRSLWDQNLVRRAFGHFAYASEGNEFTTYHLEAAIAAHHSKAAGDEDTDWAAILDLYDQLLALNPSPIVALNRSVALSRVQGPEAGLAAVAEIEAHSALRDYYLLPATRADLFSRLGAVEQASDCYRQALARPCSEPERRFLERRLASFTQEVASA